jgi:hypothetical protein
MVRLFKLMDHYLRATFAPTRIVKVIEKDTLLGNDELCPLFSRLELDGRINQALVFIDALREIRRNNEIVHFSSLSPVFLFDFGTTEVL